MLHYLFSNTLISGKLLKYKNILKTGAYSYISLHIAISKQDKKTSLIYLFKSILISPRFIFQRRFLAILKHLVFCLVSIFLIKKIEARSLSNIVITMIALYCQL